MNNNIVNRNSHILESSIPAEDYVSNYDLRRSASIPPLRFRSNSIEYSSERRQSLPTPSKSHRNSQSQDRYPLQTDNTDMLNSPFFPLYYDYKQGEVEEHEIDVLTDGNDDERFTPSPPSSFFPLQDPFPRSATVTPGSPQDKLRIAVITSWLNENYVQNDEYSIPRGQLYSHYLQHCLAKRVEPVNAATFGKIIRSCFTNLRTRRLGTRGQSRYHYCGIRPRQTGSQFPEQSPSRDLYDRTSPFSYSTPTFNIPYPRVYSTYEQDPRRFTTLCDLNNSAYTSPVLSPTPKKLNTATGYYGAAQPASYLPLSSSKIDMPHHFPMYHFTEDPIVVEWTRLYTQKSMYLVELLAQNMSEEANYVIRIFFKDSMTNIREKILQDKHIAEFVDQIDDQMYTSILKIWLPNIVHPLPTQSLQNMRKIASSFEIRLAEVLLDVDIPDSSLLFNAKMKAAADFVLNIFRQTSVNHLAYAANLMLQMPSQRANMLTDWDHLDVKFIHRQIAWMMDCPLDIQSMAHFGVDSLIRDYHSTLDQWSIQLENIMEEIMKVQFGSSWQLSDCKIVICKWTAALFSYVKELTLRSAPSFGAFHILANFIGEYVAYYLDSQCKSRPDARSSVTDSAFSSIQRNVSRHSM